MPDTWQAYLTEEEQGWLERSRAIVQQLMTMRRATGSLPTAMEEEQTNLEKTLYGLAEAREKLEAKDAALEFYADESNYPSMWLRNRGVADDMAAPMARDCGERARITLDTPKGANKRRA